MKTMTIAVSPEQASRIEKAIQSGAYASDGEVLREALRLWEQREELRDADLEQLRAAYARGIASGPGRVVDAAELLKTFKTKAANNG